MQIYHSMAHWAVNFFEIPQGVFLIQLPLIPNCIFMPR